MDAVYRWPLCIASEAVGPRSFRISNRYFSRDIPRVNNVQMEIFGGEALKVAVIINL